MVKNSHVQLATFFRHYFSSITLVKLLQTLRFFSENSVTTPSIKCAASSATKTLRSKNVLPKLQNLSLIVTKRNCPAGTLFFAQYPNLSAETQNDRNHHIAQTLNAPKLCFTQV